MHTASVSEVRGRTLIPIDSWICARDSSTYFVSFSNTFTISELWKGQRRIEHHSNLAHSMLTWQPGSQLIVIAT